jgi:hypothetical protein
MPITSAYLNVDTLHLKHVTRFLMLTGLPKCRYPALEAFHKISDVNWFTSISIPIRSHAPCHSHCKLMQNADCMKRFMLWPERYYNTIQFSKLSRLQVKSRDQSMYVLVIRKWALSITITVTYRQGRFHRAGYLKWEQCSWVNNTLTPLKTKMSPTNIINNNSGNPTLLNSTWEVELLTLWQAQ